MLNKQKIILSRENDHGGKANYKKGMKGKSVTKLQKLLNKILNPSPDLKPDGDFGEKRRKAVLCFQKDAKIKADGIVGEGTWKILVGASSQQITIQLPQFALADIASKYIGTREAGNNLAGNSKKMLEIFNADDLEIGGKTD